MKLTGGIEVLVLSGVHTVGKCILWGNLLFETNLKVKLMLARPTLTC